MKKVLIYPNITKNNIENAIIEVSNLLISLDVDVYISDFACSHNCGLKLIDTRDFDGDLIITLGGDGTILNLVNQNLAIPIIGINLGHTGFLAELEMSELDFLKKAISDDCTVDHRMLLELKIVRKNNEILHSLALNDVIIKAEDSFRIMYLKVLSDGKEVFSFGGDGVIFATPTGSTAYSLAAGGSIVEPECNMICVTPISPINFPAKSFVFSKNRQINVEIIKRNDILSYVAVDGNGPTHVYPGDKISIKSSKKTIPFLRVKDEKFYDVVRQKIGGNFF